MSFDDRLLNGVTALAAVVRSGGFAAAARSSKRVPTRHQPCSSAARGAGWNPAPGADDTLRLPYRPEREQIYETIAILSALEDATSALAEGKVTVRGNFTVNVSPYFSQLILGPQLSGFLKAYPELKVDLITREGLGDLISDGYDLGIRFGEPRPSTLVARRLLDTRVLTVASPGYLKNTATLPTRSNWSRNDIG